MSNESATRNYTIELVALRYKSLQGSEMKHITGRVREVLLHAYPALKYFPRHLLIHCHKHDGGLANSMNWAVPGQTSTLQPTTQHMGTALCKRFNLDEALQDIPSSL